MLKGSPGSILELANGNISLEFDNNINESKLKRFIISECSFIFSIDKKIIFDGRDAETPKENFYVNIRENEENIFLPLININEKSIIEIRDSNFTSFINYEDSSLLTKKFDDICIYTTHKKENYNKSVTNEAKIYINSCIFVKFSTIINSCENTKIRIEKSDFHNISQDILLCHNPKKFILRNTFLTSKGNAVNIKQSSRYGQTEYYLNGASQ